MSRPVFKFAAGAVLFGRLVSVGKYLALTALYATMVRVFTHWILMIIATVIAISAIVFFVQAREIYVHARPPESWPDRERRLRSRAMYVPRER